MITMIDHCSFCGSNQLVKDNAQHCHCLACDKINFINPACAAGCYLVDCKGNIGLAKRAHEPRKGKYDEAGWFVDITDASCEDTVIRELQEELGISILKDQLHYLTSHIMLYPFQGRANPVMCILYYATITDAQKNAILVNDDVEEFIRVNHDTFEENMMCSAFQAEQVQKLLMMK